MPTKFEEGVLYVSKKFGIAGHLCACGCGNKVWTPLGKAEWSIKNGKRGVTMWPSIGNGQLPCKSHYIIENNKIIWLPQMDEETTEIHLREAEDKRKKYYKDLNHSIFIKFKSRFIMSWYKLIKKAVRRNSKRT